MTAAWWNPMKNLNFVFLIEGDHQTRGLHMEVEDESWAALCDATRNQVEPLPKHTLEEVHWWAHFLARESPESFRTHLRAFPPNDPTLHSLLNLMVSSGHLWSDQVCNEDTYLKSRLGPFLETYFGNITFTTSGWTQTQCIYQPFGNYNLRSTALYIKFAISLNKTALKAY
ncbi:hypothetical protein BC939DRAFT_34683 [Gamsiella multidivaricata]|uniref:uncharacterized protein n=1 Tax=Gamsiella multidivaricata TaxID=101098 RepID=UPI00221F2607|nr:uncharacterized protein BC939DRAFT_34683 [Gamsiella multidivaricata]KAI7816620.1 hypothetical protein BC939DRAFT_34683 [Gamsiella multidivaricata]